MNVTIDTREASAAPPPIGLAVRSTHGHEYAELFIRGGRSEFGVNLREDELEHLLELGAEALAEMRGAAAGRTVASNIIPFRPRA